MFQILELIKAYVLDAKLPQKYSSLSETFAIKTAHEYRS